MWRRLRVPAPDGRRLLSLVDGSSRPVGADEVFLCSATTPWPHRFDTGGTGVVGFGDERARRFVEPCSSTGKELGAGAVDRVGADGVDDVWMARLNVYVPDELAARSREAGLNVSALTQQAIAAALAAGQTDTWLSSLPRRLAEPVSLGTVLEALDETRDHPGAGG